MNYINRINLFKQHTKNTLGRDFVCGDIHGMYDLLMNYLNAVNFNESQDRLFACGDLIDRGKQSLAVINLLNESWFHSVLGNHEILFLEAFESKNAYVWNYNGGGFIDIYGEEENSEWMYNKIIDKMFVMCEIQTEIGKVGVVHAELYDHLSWDENLQLLINSKDDVNPDFFNHKSLSVFIQKMTWGRHNCYSNNYKGIENIDYLFHGHTIQTKELIKKKLIG